MKRSKSWFPRRRRTMVAALAASAALVAVSSGNAAFANSSLQTDEIMAQVSAFIEENPGDFAGLEALTTELYGNGLTVAVEGVDGTLSGAEAQAVLDAQGEIPEDSAGVAARGIQSVPVDAFSVAFTFIPLPGDDDVYWAAYGTWDFRDDFVNGSAPDDFASIRLANNSSGCLSLGATYVHTYTYDGAATGKGYLYDAGAGTNSPIAGVRDGVSGFKMDADHGVVLSHLRSHYCGPVDLSGMFTYEHNQDGGTVASVSASFFGFGVSYSAPSSTLQKSSGIVQF